jgi:hypothetical protein
MSREELELFTCFPLSGLELLSRRGSDDAPPTGRGSFPLPGQVVENSRYEDLRRATLEPWSSDRFRKLLADARTANLALTPINPPADSERRHHPRAAELTAAPSPPAIAHGDAKVAKGVQQALWALERDDRDESDTSARRPVDPSMPDGRARRARSRMTRRAASSPRSSDWRLSPQASMLSRRHFRTAPYNTWHSESGNALMLQRA